jgi:hypothetical protein
MAVGVAPSNFPMRLISVGIKCLVKGVTNVPHTTCSHTKNRLLKTKTVMFHGRKLVLVLARWSSVPGGMVNIFIKLGGS